MKQININNNTDSIYKNQNIYDGFNTFIMSEDRNVFNKLYSRISFYEMTRNIHGDIVECGVFKGSGIFTWLKILDMNEPNSIKKVIGFDFFSDNFVNNLSNIDKKSMDQVFKRCKFLDKKEISLDYIKNMILSSKIKEEKFDLIQGDVVETTKKYLIDKPGFRISLLYLDLDLEIPTYEALNNLWEKVSYGGVVVFDEYGYHCWSESNGVDKFVTEKKLILHKTNVKAPTAYIIKQ